MKKTPVQAPTYVPTILATISLVVLWPAAAAAGADLSFCHWPFGYHLQQGICQLGDYGSSFLESQPLSLSRGSEQTRFFRVIRVIDGDSLEVEGVGEVRLIGVDSPELYHPLKPVQYYAREASEFVRKLLEQSRVRLEFDQEKYDKYGRTLAYVYLEDGRSLNEEIIKNGYGFTLLRFPFKHLLRYKQLEARAREAGLGLWRQQGLDEFNWILRQQAVPYEIFEMANNWWAVRYKEFVKLRLTPEEVQQELLNLRQWTNEFSASDLEKTLLNHGWLKIEK
ncbi:MAG: thermonuclease family protein [Candidatus Saccharicenans sp.]|uniref:thermonuclease family protein n=1 Tax=Candidatus Saccharicenans sp. TaxID=2819258 RepID=UPI00404AD3F0